jgi:hypothetical protein
VSSMLAAYRRLVAEGRSTPGRQQANDVNVREYPKQP